MTPDREELCEDMAASLTRETGWRWSSTDVARAMGVMWDDVPAEDDPRVALAAAHGGLTCREIGDIMGLSRERIRQIEGVALRKLRGRVPAEWLRQLKEAIVADPYDGPIPMELQCSVEQGDEKSVDDAASAFLEKRDPFSQRNTGRARKAARARHGS